MLFSATMPSAIEGLARSLLANPRRIDILPEGKAAKGISHRLYLVAPEDKHKCLLALLSQELGSTLVFIRRRLDVDWLYRSLQKAGHPVERLHSDRSQGQRVEALDSFREGAHRILVATDIAARGIDVPHIRHVVNFDMPETVEDYIHRAGRTARGRSTGIVSTIGTWIDTSMVKQVERAMGEAIPRCSVPGIEPYVEAPPKKRLEGRRRPVRR
jgi:ATP-dependent RNA helicase RhlE